MSGLMGKLTSLMSRGLLDSVGNIADKFIQTPDEKAAFKVELEKVLQQRDKEVEQTIRAELQAKERIIVAEMAQGDNYTKRARPTVIYFGLAIIAFNYCLIPLVQLATDMTVEAFTLPAEFWLAWGGCVGVYNIGRSMEKRGNRNKLTQAAVGSKPLNLLD